MGIEFQQTSFPYPGAFYGFSKSQGTRVTMLEIGEAAKQLPGATPIVEVLEEVLIAGRD